MADPFITLLLNAAFWGGMWTVVARSAAFTWVERVLATAWGGMATIVVSLELLSIVGQIKVGAVFVLLLLPLAILAIVQRPRPLRQLAWLATGMLVPSAYWYARNVWLTVVL